MGAKGAFNPKSIYEVMANAPTRDHRGASLVSKKEIPMLRAFSKKYKDRNVLINKTPFSFDSDGFCAVQEISDARSDFELLLKMNHIDEVLDEPETLEEEAREEDTREGIDAPLLVEEPEEDEELDEEVTHEDLGLDEEEEPEEEPLDEEPDDEDDSEESDD